MDFNQGSSGSCVAHALAMLMCIVIATKFPTFEVEVNTLLPILLATATGKIWNGTNFITFLNEFMNAAPNYMFIKSRENLVQIVMNNTIPQVKNFSFDELKQSPAGTAVVVIVKMRPTDTENHAVVAISRGKDNEIIAVNSWGGELPVLIVKRDFGEPGFVKFISWMGVLDFTLKILTPSGEMTTLVPISQSEAYTCTRQAELMKKQKDATAAAKKTANRESRLKTIAKHEATTQDRHTQALKTLDPKKPDAVVDMQAFLKRRKPTQTSCLNATQIKKLEAITKKKYDCHRKRSDTLLKKYVKGELTHEVFLLESQTMDINITGVLKRDKDMIAGLKAKASRKLHVTRTLDRIMKNSFDDIVRDIELGREDFLESNNEEEAVWFNKICGIAVGDFKFTPTELYANHDHIQESLKRLGKQALKKLAPSRPVSPVETLPYGSPMSPASI